MLWHSHPKDAYSILTMVQKGRIPAWKNYLSIEYIDAVYEMLTA